MCCPENDTVRGTVNGFGLFAEGEQAIVETADYGSVVVPLNSTCWRGLGGPKLGDTVEISGVTASDNYWQALQARFCVHEDEAL